LKVLEGKNGEIRGLIGEIRYSLIGRRRGRKKNLQIRRQGTLCRSE